MEYPLGFRQIVVESAKEGLASFQERVPVDERLLVDKKINELAGVIQQLNDQLTTLTDQEFEKKLRSLGKDLAEVIYPGRLTENNRPYTTEFRKWEGINSLEDYMKEPPMYWLPRKEEIGRILSVAVQMNNERKKRGEIRDNAPISILDIGGGSGALEKLLLEIADENNVDINCTIVDPDVKVVDLAQQGYAHESRMKFIGSGIGDFNAKHQIDFELQKMLLSRAKMIEEGEKRRAQLLAVIEKAYKKRRELEQSDGEKERFNKIFKFFLSRGKSLSHDEAEMLYGIFEHDLEISINDDLREHPDFISWVLEICELIIGGKACSPHELKLYKEFFSREKNKIGKITRQIEERIASIPAQYDLVINSWMPPCIDFTMDIRAANGAAIVYVLSANGATGTQHKALQGVKGVRLSDEDSYNPGQTYCWQQGWVGVSYNQLKDRIYSFSESDKVEADGNTPIIFSNSIVIQTRKEYFGQGQFDCNPTSLGVTISGTYPWEKQLSQKCGPVPEILPVSGEWDDGSDYHKNLQQMVDKMRQKQHEAGVV